MFKRADKDQQEIAKRLCHITKGQNYKDINNDLQDSWYRRAGLLVAMTDSIEKAEQLLDFIEGKDMA